MKALCVYRDKMRENNEKGLIPVTMDELMFRFCINEKRKAYSEILEENQNVLLNDRLDDISPEQVTQHVEASFDAMKGLFMENSAISTLSRFKNE